ncbi:hypothetical protein HDU76_011387, partial [Blyttiomyces sp. JEL0837]
MFSLFNEDEDAVNQKIPNDNDDLFSTEPPKSIKIPKYFPPAKQTEPTGTILSEVSVRTTKIVQGHHPLAETDLDHLAILDFAFNGIVEEY